MLAERPAAVKLAMNTTTGSRVKRPEGKEDTMKRLATGLMLAMLPLVPTAAWAGSSTDAALGLGAFAVFNQILGGTGIFAGLAPAPHAVHYAPPPPVYVAPPPSLYVVPRPVYVQPRPVYVAPSAVYVAPRPVYVAPRPIVVYETRAPFHAQYHGSKHGGKHGTRSHRNH
jgi:hypothetical protein